MDTSLFNMLSVEIQETIALFLSQHDLNVCVRVCQAWKTLFHPHLWSHIHHFLTIGGGWRYNFGSVLEANKHFIRSLRLESSSGKVLKKVLPLCPAFFPNLTAAYVKAPFGLDLDEDFARFIRLSSSGWRRLKFHKCRRLYSTVRFGMGASKALLEHAPTLEVLRTNFNSEMDQQLVDELLCSAPNLKELYLQNNHEDGCGGCLDAAAIVNSEWV
ncbi:hypothetical protein BGZ96_007925 [Linnemannia gamsii]|uniref:F-box domain-containing protein n=1 Tax=Linnemannia gamsii TaxID=64522 RepID=A0ABQ7K049_9FUNG|nr:hypothetical protein BGZ96_007925 [Linnemannia gamsii]